MCTAIAIHVYGSCQLSIKTGFCNVFVRTLTLFNGRLINVSYYTINSH